MMGECPKVSVIMPCYGMGRFVGQAIESVAAQSLSEWEIVAVDDCGSDDGTGGIMAAFQHKHPEHRVEWVRHEMNRGVSAARNTAIRAARGGYLAFLDPDDFWMPEHLARAVKFLDENAEYSAVASPVGAFWDDSPEEVHVCEFSPTMVNAFPASLALDCFIQPSAVVVRRQDVIDVGLFDEAPAIQHVEDLDLWIRLGERGCRFKFMMSPTCRYRRHAAGATADFRRMEERKYAIVDKHSRFLVRQYMALFRSIIWTVDSGKVLSGPSFRTLAAVDRGLRKMKRWICRGTGGR